MKGVTIKYEVRPDQIVDLLQGKILRFQFLSPLPEECKVSFELICKGAEVVLSREAFMKLKDELRDEEIKGLIKYAPEIFKNLFSIILKKNKRFLRKFEKQNGRIYNGGNVN